MELSLLMVNKPVAVESLEPAILVASRVAEMLGVSRASAGEMLRRLEAEGLVERGEHKEAILTDTGGFRFSNTSPRCLRSAARR